MIPLLFSNIGVRGSLIIGFAIAEIITHYWNSKKYPPKIYILGRRVHHGEIGAILAFSLLFGKFSPSAGIVAGLGAGLVKDDFVDIYQWFICKSRKNFLKQRLIAYRRYRTNR